MPDLYLCVSPDDKVEVGAAGVVWHGPEAARGFGADLSTRVLIDAPSRWAVRAPLLSGAGVSPRDLAFGAQAQAVYRAVALLRHRERYRFDPADGSKLQYSPSGDRATGASGREVFPRIDPAVIGIVEHVDSGRILLGRNALRPQYFSLIAGYVSVGETLEQAFVREVWEETGRRVRDVRYVDSQPWPTSSSLMIGFHGVSADEQAHGPTDGELAEVKWVSAAEINEGRIPLAPAGSLAHSMIFSWAST